VLDNPKVNKIQRCASELNIKVAPPRGNESEFQFDKGKLHSGTASHYNVELGLDLCCRRS